MIPMTNEISDIFRKISENFCLTSGPLKCYITEDANVYYAHYGENETPCVGWVVAYNRHDGTIQVATTKKLINDGKNEVYYYGDRVDMEPKDVFRAVSKVIYGREPNC